MVTDTVNITGEGEVANQGGNLGLYYGWSLGESGWNEQNDANIRALDALSQLSAIDHNVNGAPATPADGDTYLTGDAPVGAWTGFPQHIAVWRSDLTAWQLYPPRPGWRAFVVSQQADFIFEAGNGWVPKQGSLTAAERQKLQSIEENATADQNAAEVPFDNSASGLAAEQVQAAIDEVATIASSGGVADGGVAVVKLADFSYNPATTTGLTLGLQGGTVRVNNGVVKKSASTVTLAASSTNFVEVNALGVVSSNTTGFTTNRIPLYTVATDSGSVVTVTDERAWLSMSDLSGYLKTADAPGVFRPGINNQTGTSYTLVLSDDNTVVRCANASAINVTVPAEATTDFPVGAIIQVRQVDAGQVTLVADTGVTLITPETLKTRKQGSTIALMKVGADEWDVTGDMEGAV